MEAVLESQVQLQNLFLKKMEVFEAQLQASSSSTTTSDPSSLAEDFAAFRTFILAAIKSLQEQILLLAKESDFLEMRSRQKILLIHGVPEDKSSDPTTSAVDVVVKQLKIPEFKVSDISRCHRMGQTSTDEKPRPILLKLHNLTVKHKLWQSKSALKGSGVTLSEFLTKPRHSAFMSARQRFGINKCWTKDGIIFVMTPDGKRHRITCAADLEKIEAVEDPKTAPAKGKKPDVKKPASAPKARETRR